MIKRILIYADSRGQHKAAGSTHELFAERLIRDNRFIVDMYLSPMKWTTTLDFLETFSEDQLASYDHIILFTGIVDWSPRPVTSAKESVYDNVTEHTWKAQHLIEAFDPTSIPTTRIINNKKEIFDKVFDHQVTTNYLNRPFVHEYAGEKTINMYSHDSAKNKLIPRLKKIENLKIKKTKIQDF